MIEQLCLGALVRMAQALMSAGPTLIVGWLIAAIFERILGRDGTFKLFGGHTWRQLPQAWLLGMLLPVCSLGVIPVMRQMKRSGIAGGTILAFGLTAPLFNPISVLYGLTLSDPIAIMVFCLCSLTIVTVLGLAWDWIFPLRWNEPEPLPKTPYGIKRVAAVALSMCQQAFGRDSLYILIAVGGVGLLSMFLPSGVLQRAASHDNPWAPVTMAAVATFAYVTPMVAIVQVASMFQHGNSIGASFTLLVLGTGVNLGMLVWILRHYAWKPTLAWIACLLAVVLALGYAVGGPLYPSGVEPADHTHAFDSYCNPFQDSQSTTIELALSIVRDSLRPDEIVAAALVVVILLAGFCFWFFDRQQRLMQWLTTPPKTVSKKDIVLPNSVIASVCLVGLVLASIGGCFLYYPPQAEIESEMHAINAELYVAANTHDWDTVAYWIPIQEDWAHKLSVSGYLRGRPVTRFQQMRTKVFLSKLEMLEHSSEDRELEEVDRWKKEMASAFLRLRRAFSDR